MKSTETQAPPGGAADGASTLYLYLVVFVAAVGGFLFGYDLSLISGAIIFLERQFSLTPTLTGMVMGSAILGCPFGPLAGVWIADAIGRRRTLMLAGFLFVASAAGCALSDHIIVFIIWRFIGGMGVGLASTVSPMFIAEVAPAHLRGRLVMVFQLAVGIGLSMSVFVDYLLSFGGHWRLMFATQGIPVLAFLAGLAVAPESPRWLAAAGRLPEALRVLTRINGKARAEAELGEIEEELREESGGFAELLQPGVFLALITGVVLMVYSQIDGANMIVLYTPTLFVAAGLTKAPDAILNSVYLDAWILICTGIAFWLIRVFPRRNILIGGGIGMVIGHILMFVNFTCHLPPTLALLAMLVPVGSYVLTLGPLSWVVISEIFPNRVRGKAMCLATCSMFAASYVTTNLFPIALQRFKAHYGHPGGTFLIFSFICACGTLFVWRMLPETKDKTLEQMGKFWLELHHERKSR
jgi:sugar porter (SP) family MFS transporter